MHLWEIEHPYYGAEGEVVNFESIDELIENVNRSDADMNHVYRWDWNTWDGDGEPTFTVFVVLQRKSRLVSWSAPVTEADEPKVRELLASNRLLGALKAMWEPLLRDNDVASR